LAGNGSAGYGGDGGPARAASLNQPANAVTDAAGSVYIADLGNLVVRKVDAAGNISTFAGNGSDGFSGDGGPAASAQLSQPFGLLFDAGGNLYIADRGENGIRKVDHTTGNISTFQGNGTTSPANDGGQATNAGGQAQYMAITSAGFFFADDANTACA
jgi:sugar lactone lactonase YvrE